MSECLRCHRRLPEVQKRFDRCQWCGRRIGAKLSRSDNEWVLSRCREALSRKGALDGMPPEVRRALLDGTALTRAQLALQLHILERLTARHRSTEVRMTNLRLWALRRRTREVEPLWEPPRSEEWPGGNLVRLLQGWPTDRVSVEVRVTLEQLKTLSRTTYTLGGTTFTVRLGKHPQLYVPDLVVLGGKVEEYGYLPRGSWDLSAEQAEVYHILRRDGMEIDEAHNSARLLV